MMRLFIGLGLGDGAKDALWSAVSGMGIRGQLTLKENYHLTLAFLGDRDERKAKPIERILEAAAKGCSPLGLTVRELGFFGKRENALLHAKLAPCPPLHSLSDRLRRLLAAAGEAFDTKPFAAHITLARQADLTAVNLPKMEPVPFTAGRLTLYHSTRAQGVLRYVPIFETPFREDGEQA
jgi:RNA 2',3'-cyclic 3'-phosphodiesterase